MSAVASAGAQMAPAPSLRPHAAQEAEKNAQAAADAAMKLSVRQLIREDTQAAFERDPSADSTAAILRFSVGARIVRAYRRQHWLYTHGHKWLALWLAKRTRIKFGADIHPGAQIGRRFVVDHGIGTVIGGTAIIGDDCLMYQGVTLGMTGKHGGKRHPTLGSNVMVGAGSILLGTIVVGDGARVGAGSVVVDDVPPHTTVVGNPARVVRTRECPLFDDVVCVTDDFGKSWLMES